MSTAAHTKPQAGRIEHALPQFTKQHLSGKISRRETLGQFLSGKCSQIGSATAKIYSTSSWLNFSFLAENRPINEAHILSLMDSFRKDGYLFTILYMNEKLEIIDGQHRYEAAKRLLLPIYFMVMPGWGIWEVTVLNVNSRNWSMLDFLASYAKAGNENYIRFKVFCEAHPFEITTSQLLVLGRRTGRKGMQDTFRLGKMEVSDIQVGEAIKKAAMIADLQLFHPLGWASRNFVEAMLRLFSQERSKLWHLYRNSFPVKEKIVKPEIILASKGGGMQGGSASQITLF